MKDTPKDNAPGLAVTEGAIQNTSTDADSIWRGLIRPAIYGVLLGLAWLAGVLA